VRRGPLLLRRVLGLLAAIPLAITCLAGPARAGEDGDVGPREGKGFCKRPFTKEAAFQSPASADLYNALLYMGGTAAVEFGTTAERRWTGTNGFDKDIRSGLRGGSASSRKDANTASDVMLAVSAGVLPLASIGKTLSEGDCYQAYDMTTDALESIMLTLLVTEAAKSIAGRERPFVQECDGSPPSDARCGDRDRKQSFWSGHAATAAAGAGLSCSYAIKRKTWGDGATAQAVPCALGAGAALTTGILRITADKHWATDVFVGLAVGATVGYFDTWGPFDLLRFEAKSDDGVWDAQGVVLPYAGEGQIGARLSVAF
jgi:hypothetical protein